MKPVFKNRFRVGDIVKIKMEILYEPKGTPAYCYEEYKLGHEEGCSFITINGVDMGGFSAKEQWWMLDEGWHSGVLYTFSSVINLAIDFRNGVFNHVFEKPVKHE